VNVLELFAGAGGAAIGLKRAGMDHLLCVEWNEAACRTLEAAGLPALQHDLREPLPVAIEQHVDAMWSSTPCQPFSTAGKRLGAQDERNGFPWMWARVDEHRPRWLMVENVPGMLMHSGGADNCPGGRPDECSACYFHEVVLAEARRRFAWVGYRVLNSSAYGVPQHRRRVYLVCGPRRIRWPAPTHCDPDHGILLAAGLRPWVSVGEALGLSGEFNTSFGEAGYRKPKNTQSDQPTGSVTTKGIMLLEPMGHPEWAKSVDGPADAVGTKGNAYLSRSRTGRMRMNYPLSSPPENPRGPSDLVKRHEVETPELPASTVRTGAPVYLLEKQQRRRLTCEEQARLMAFPDGWPFQGNKTQKYSQSGNACCPPVVEAIGRAVMEADDMARTATTKPGEGPCAQEE